MIRSTRDAVRVTTSSIILYHNVRKMLVEFLMRDFGVTYISQELINEALAEFYGQDPDVYLTDEMIDRFLADLRRDVQANAWGEMDAT